MLRLLLTLALVATAACERPATPAPAPPTVRPVAVVNGTPISAEALRRELALSRAGEDGPAPLEVRRRAVADLVDRALLAAEARTRGLTASPAEVERAFAGLRAGYPEGELERLLAAEKLAAEDVKAHLAEQLAVGKLFEEAVFPAVRVTDAQIRARYAERAASFEQPPQVRALQLVTRTREEAEKARAEVRRSPKAFADVARRVSIAPEAQRGGDLGWFGRGAGMPEVFDVCFTLPVNKISDVVPSPYGFHVFQVLERRAARRLGLEDVRDALGRELEREARARAQDEFVAGLRARAQIQIDTAALDAATGTP